MSHTPVTGQFREADKEQKQMQVKLLYFGEGVTIPKTAISAGVSAVSVWINGSGYTSASNDLGATGYLCLETPTVDVGDPDADTTTAFANLHAQVVTFDISPNIFIKDGGIARVSITRPVQTDGGLVDRKIEFVATDCTGVSIVSNALSFSVEMLQMLEQVASSDNVLGDEDIVAIAEAAPSSDDTVTATA